VKSHEPSNSQRSKGVTVSIPKGSKLRRSRTIDPSHKGHWIYTYILVSGFRGWKSYKCCNGNREITKHDIPKAKGLCGPWRIQRADRWHTISEFCRVKS
jgi:hypothetical protein